MAFPFFTEDEQPTMANFNAKFQALVNKSLEIATGWYTGTATTQLNASKTIYLGFRPKLFLLTSIGSFTDPGTVQPFTNIGAFGSGEVILGFYATGNARLNQCGTITNTGVQLSSGIVHHTDVTYYYTAIG